MTTYTVFFKAQAADGSRFLSSTAVRALDKYDAAKRVMAEYAYAREVTSVMIGR